MIPVTCPHCGQTMLSPAAVCACAPAPQPSDLYVRLSALHRDLEDLAARDEDQMRPAIEALCVSLSVELARMEIGERRRG